MLDRPVGAGWATPLGLAGLSLWGWLGYPFGAGWAIPLGVRSGIRAHLHGLPEGLEGVFGGGDEFVGEEVGEFLFFDFSENGGVVDLLGVVEFATAGVAGGVEVADEVFVLAEAADEVAVHDGDVVEIEEEFDVG